MSRMGEYAMDDDNESGLLDYECQHWEEEQDILRADPAFNEWAASIENQRTEEYESEIRSESIH